MQERISSVNPAKKSNLESRLIRYALAGGAVLGAPMAANAGIVYSGLIDATFSGNSSNFLSPLDFTLSTTDNGDGTGAVSVSGPVTTFFVPGTEGPAAMNFGDLISLANATGPGGDLLRSHTLSTFPFSYKTGDWGPSSSHYLGFQFNLSGSQVVGWAQLQAQVNCPSFCGPGGPSVTLIDFAYEDQAGAPIAAGQTVPEPSGLALFAMGAAGVLALRKRRQKTEN
jgi:hypothetical protein